MPPVGGSIESITLKGRTFSVAADNEAQRKIGGFENEIQANGDGTSRIVKTRVPPSFAGLTVAIDDAASDQEFLQGLADGNEFFPVSLTLASGEVWQGLGQISGELQTSTQNATASFDIMGTGVFTRQA